MIGRLRIYQDLFPSCNLLALTVTNEHVHNRYVADLNLFMLGYSSSYVANIIFLTAIINNRLLKCSSPRCHRLLSSGRGTSSSPQVRRLVSGLDWALTMLGRRAGPYVSGLLVTSQKKILAPTMMVVHVPKS